MKKFLLLFTCLCMMQSVCHAYDEILNVEVREAESSALAYNILSETDKTVEVVANGNEYYSGDVVIPATVNIEGVIYTVVRIGNNAFHYCDGLTSITIPNSVTTIGNYAFSNCRNLNSMTIPNSVTTIGAYTFSDCSSLASISIPNSVTTIGEYAFYWCGSLTSITIPNSMTTIERFTFSDCSSLVSISIPNSVTTIGEYSFRFCSSLTSITIPNSVTTIGEGTFSDCSSLTSITIPNSVTTIGGDAFSGCRSMTSINVDAANQAYSSIDGVLYNKEQTCLIRYPGGKLGEVIIPNSVTTIGENAFYCCDALTTISIPNSVTTIGDYSFSGCTSLTKITIPNSVTTIGESSFDTCISLTTITIPDSVTTIGGGAFFMCLSLTSVTSLAVTPPECGEYVFGGVDTDNCTLYVPVNSIPAYKQASEWKAFAKIEPAVESGIEAVEVDAEGATKVYNLMGVKVANSLDNLPTGIYIVNGRKVVVK